MADKNVAKVGLLSALDNVPGAKQLILLTALALSISIGVTAAFWFQKPAMSLLYSNIEGRDANEVVDVLEASEIPFELDRRSGAILVADDRIHDARLKLAAQGLPRGAGFGLEIIEGDSGFSTSQFIENARYQHALETELGRTISRLRPVQTARVHLAVPKSTVFLRQKKKPSASVLTYLYSGRSLEESQVSSIVHLVASSVPDLDADNVTVVDQHGRLLNSPDKDSEMAMSTRQFDYIRKIEESYVERIVNLLTPMLGPNRIRATVAADIDFTVREETREDYDPNDTVVRSEQVSEDRSRGGAGLNGGIPGALSNQPPPQVAQGATQDSNETSETEQQAVTPMSESIQRTRNFELGRVLSHTRDSTGEIRRLSVAVLVDDRSVIGEDGEPVSAPLTTTELDDLTRLIKEAVGFQEERGDSVSVSNVPFYSEPEGPAPEAPGFFDQPGMRDYVKQGIGAIILLVLGLGIIRPLVRNLTASLTPTPVAAAPGGGGSAPQALSYEDKVSVARQLAEKNPERVAQIVRQWVQTDG